MTNKAIVPIIQYNLFIFLVRFLLIKISQEPILIVNLLIISRILNMKIT